MREERGEPGRGLIGIIVGLSLLLLANGCAPALYSVNMRYEPTKVTPPAPTDGRKYSVTVASFVDQRKMEDTLLIGRVIKSDGATIPILPQYVKPPDAVASALRELLFQVGIRRLPGQAALGPQGSDDPAGVGNDPRRRNHR